MGNISSNNNQILLLSALLHPLGYLATGAPGELFISLSFSRFNNNNINNDSPNRERGAQVLLRAGDVQYPRIKRLAAPLPRLQVSFFPSSSVPLLFTETRRDASPSPLDSAGSRSRRHNCWD